ncbi:acetyltransferase [Corynebacterium phocae]|uniref:Acetyltransferase n=1 Tax=Corynebacterium phocae TaxID=161895 RepID=A0A1L7D2F6_9CORY|nr:acyltransferase family protein [Corynebacterium phocae]APT92298.1 acetyltransferase [Corynebacterium phocae]KAA8725333.1 acyltransferase [Corynebacterium phocae]
MTTPATSFRYRFDLDGLRGIAIALVVIYHVFVGRVSGGVDVFLLLSGYFFLGSQLRYADKPNASFNPWWPLWRTLRRLAPALVLTLAATFLLVLWLSPQLLRTEFAQQLTATVFYYQNWELARQHADYAAASASTSPLQHLWSMAVQGQFYLASILFALGLGLLLRNRRRSVRSVAGPVLIVITMASFAYASRYGFYAPASNYYDTLARAWELSLGGVLAIYGAKAYVPERLRNLFTGIGLIAVVTTGMIISDSTAYPGPLSLLPIGGAVLIIISGGSRISQAMTSKVALWLGDIAYSLYLWHWPLLIVSTSWLNQRTPPWWLGISIIAISLLLADLTNRFVEKPLRQSRKRPLADDMPVNRALASLRTVAGKGRAAGGVAVGLVALAVLSVLPLWMNQINNRQEVTLDPDTYPGAMAHHGAKTPSGIEPQPDTILVGGLMPPTSITHCFIAKQADPDHFTEETKDGEPCIFGDPNAEFNVYLVGGSHAEQWSSGLDKLGKEMGFKIIPLLRQDCPLELGPNVGVSPECAEWSELAFEKIVDGEADLVISNTTRPGTPFGYGPDAVPEGYIGFWERLAEEEIPFLGLRDNPWGFDSAGNPREFDECYVALEDPIECGMPREKVYAPVDPGAVVLSRFDNMIAVDTSDWFCDSTHCPVIVGNVFVYRDMHHISNAFSDSAMPLLRSYIQPFMDGKEQKQEAPEVPDDAPAPVSSTATAPDVQELRPAVPVPYPRGGAGDPV